MSATRGMLGRRRRGGKGKGGAAPRLFIFSILYTVGKKRYHYLLRGARERCKVVFVSELEN